jgi:hypothetical protein
LAFLFADNNHVLVQVHAAAVADAAHAYMPTGEYISLRLRQTAWHARCATKTSLQLCDSRRSAGPSVLCTAAVKTTHARRSGYHWLMNTGSRCRCRIAVRYKRGQSLCYHPAV